VTGRTIFMLTSIFLFAIHGSKRLNAGNSGRCFSLLRVARIFSLACTCIIRRMEWQSGSSKRSTTDF
jgi:hypothetical protein